MRSVYHGGFVTFIVCISVSQSLLFTTLLLHYSRSAEVHMLDVGQGDSFIVKTSKHHRVLVDTGPPKARSVERIKKFFPYFDKRIDIVLISHFDADHVGQLKEIIQKYEPQLVVIPSYDFGKDQLHNFYKRNNFATSSEATTFIELFDGDRIAAGENILDVMYPRMLDHVDLKNNNEASLVFRLLQTHKSEQDSCNEKTILFTGDIGSQAEQRIISRVTTNATSGGEKLKSDILKLAHHGSRFSSTKSFVEKVGASEALVSYGKKNNYGHPNKKVLDEVQSFGTKIFSSGELGDVTLSLCK